MIRWLQVEGGSWDVVPTRVRVVDDAGRTIAISDRSLSALIDEARSSSIGGRRGLASMVFQVPDYVIADLTEGTNRFPFQALVEDEWWPAEMIDTGARSAASAERRRNPDGGRRFTDKRGRIYIVADSPSLEDMAAEALASPRSRLARGRPRSRAREVEHERQRADDARRTRDTEHRDPPEAEVEGEPRCRRPDGACAEADERLDRLRRAELSRGRQLRDRR